MIKAILNGILNALTGVVNFLLTPINVLFVTLFPSMTNSIANFNNFVTTFFGTGLGWFFHLLPPLFRTTLITWLLFVISYYTIYYVYIGYLKIFSIIQKVKFW